MTQRRIDPVAWLAAPAAAYFLVVLGLPLVLLFAASFRTGDGVGFAHYARILGDPFERGVILATLRYAALVTLACAVFGYVYAYAMARASAPVQALLLVAIVLPMTVSVIVKTFGWTILLRSNGLVNSALLAIGAIDEPLRLLFSETGLVFGTTSILLPYMVLPVFAVLRQIPPEQGDAAATLGAAPAEAFLRVVLPLTLPGVIAGVAIVFSMTVSAYVIPSLLTGAGYKTLSKAIANAFLVIYNPGLGAAAGVILLAIAMAIVLAAGAAAARLGRTA